MKDKPQGARRVVPAHAAHTTASLPLQEDDGLDAALFEAEPSDVALLAQGSRFGVYAVGPLIGEGGMARIYRAEHEGLRRQVALKVLLEAVDKEGEEHSRFLREARIAAAIQHAHVVKIFDVGVHRGRPYLVMELLEGMDLEAFVASEGALDEPTLMDVIIPIAAALATVHQAGIVHRDLKPGNIFLARGRNDELEPKLLDFGVSKSSAQDQLRLTSPEGLPMGTPFYMSPEAARGLEVTALSDQYALGVVLYECATGVNPFAGATTFGEVVRQARTGDYPRVATLNPRLSGRLVSIIERAMERDPARRFVSVRALGRELLQLAGQRTRVTWALRFNEGSKGRGLARSTHAAPKRGRPSRTQRYLLSAALVVLGGISVGWMSLHRGEPQRKALVPAEPRVVEAPFGPSAPLAPPLEVESAVRSLTAMASSTDAEGSERSAPAFRERKARRARTDPPRSVAARPVAARAAYARPARRSKALDPDADWASSSVRLSSRANHGPDRGTNNAPILE